MTHDPKLVDELIAAIDSLRSAPYANGYHAAQAVFSARETLRSAPPKPREWWLNVYLDGDGFAYKSSEDAEESADYENMIGCFLVREVMPDDKGE